MGPVSNLNEITVLLEEAAGSERAAEDRVFELLYHELRRLARSQLGRQGNAAR